jgi:hypothetical protein
MHQATGVQRAILFYVSTFHREASFDKSSCPEKMGGADGCHELCQDEPDSLADDLCFMP